MWWSQVSESTLEMLAQEKGEDWLRSIRWARGYFHRLNLFSAAKNSGIVFRADDVDAQTVLIFDAIKGKINDLESQKRSKEAKNGKRR